MHRQLIRFFAAVLVALLWCGRAQAQTPGASETSTDQTLAQDLASAPPPGKSAATITVGGQVQGGRSETKGLKIDGIFAHTTMRHSLLRVDAEVDYARYRPAPSAEEFLVEDSRQVSLTYLHPLVDRKWYVYGGSTWRSDEVLGLSYRAFGEAGAGRVLFANAKTSAFLGASYAVGREHRDHTDVGEAVLDVGLLQNFHYRISDIAGIEEWFKGHLQTTNSDDRTYQFNVALMTKMTKYAGLKIYYKRQYDALVPPSVPNLQTEVGAGLQITFKPATPPAAKP